MIISGLDLALITLVSYFSGIGTGLIICCKYKDQIMIRSRSRDNLSSISLPSVMETPIMASAPPPAKNPSGINITLE